MPISTKIDERNDPNIIRNYGQLLVDLCEIVHDGIVCFFTSYKYMEEIVLKWDETGMLYEIMERKLVFIESKDSNQTINVYISRPLIVIRKLAIVDEGQYFYLLLEGKYQKGLILRDIMVDVL